MPIYRSKVLVLPPAFVGELPYSGETPVLVFVEARGPERAEQLIREVVSVLWQIPRDRLSVMPPDSEEQVFDLVSRGAPITGDARLFECGLDQDGSVIYAVPENTLFLVRPSVLRRLAEAQRAAVQLAHAGYRP